MGIRLTWTDPNFGEDGHNIYRSTSPMDPESLPAPIATVGANVELYDDGDVTEGVTYYYRVGAFIGSSSEMISDEISIATAFDPANLFDSSTPGAWYDPSDLSTLFKDTAGASPVTADGDAVALMLDKSGTGEDMVQGTSSYRPLYRTDGTRHWLEFDGSDDFMEATSASWLNSATELAVVTAIRIPSAAAGDNYGGILSKSTGSENSYKGFNLRESSSNGFQLFGLGTEQGAAIAGARDEDMVATGLWVDSSILAIYKNGSVSESKTPTANNPNSGSQVLTLGKLSYAGFHKAMRFYGGIIIQESVSAQRGNIDAYLGGKIDLPS